MMGAGRSDADAGPASGRRSGPLAGVRVVEFSGIGPAPFCGMLLADMGADVICIDRRDARTDPVTGVLGRGKRSIALDLKQPGDVETALRLVDRADVLLEGFRPGVMERLGLGPEPCLARRPALVYGRMTGWGQSGPLASAAGHDINYIALSGALAAIGGPGGPPAIPLNLVGDFGGGALYLAMGICAALVESRRSGEGQVIDAAMTDGAISLMTIFHAGRSIGAWNVERGTNLIDGGAPFYNVYETADGRHVAVGAIEPQFYALLLDRLGLVDPVWQAQNDGDRWPDLRDRLTALFRQRTRAEWTALLEGTDACFAPVLDLDEVADHPHNRARESVVRIDGVAQANAAPRFSRTPAVPGRRAPVPGEHGAEILAELDLKPASVSESAPQH
ncbi:MAG: CaiB/BaiF CoA transferase family protein [Sphingobium sp.]